MIFDRKTTTEVLIGQLRETLTEERLLREDRLFRRHPSIQARRLGTGVGLDVPSADRKQLLLRGHITWARVFKAHPKISERGRHDRWISVVYSPDPALDGRLGVLEQAASHLASLVDERGEDPDLEPFAVGFDDDEDPQEAFRPVTRRAPETVDDEVIFYSRLRTQRKLLPKKRLALPWFPVFAPTESQSGCRLISSKYWPWELKALWRSLD